MPGLKTRLKRVEGLHDFTEMINSDEITYLWAGLVTHGQWTTY